jgi:hypothetical protein
VDQHRDPPLVGELDEVLDRRLAHREALCPRVELYAACARIEATASLSQCVVVRIDPAERHEPTA